jgi:hypothetical protein
MALPRLEGRAERRSVTMNNLTTGHTALHRVGSGVTQFFTWPIQAIGDALELRQLRRRLPNAHRRLILTRGRARPETDAEYLDRLREIEIERFGERPSRT